MHPTTHITFADIFPFLGDPVVAGSWFYFTTFDAFSGQGNGMTLWASDGTQAGTRMVRDFTPNYDLANLVDVASPSSMACNWRARASRERTTWPG